MISMNRYNYVICTQRFYLFLSDLNAFLPFSYPSAVAHASRTMLNRSSERGVLVLFPISKEELSVFHKWVCYGLWACHVWPLLR